MIIVDTALKARAEAGNPLRVGLIGAGFMVQGLTNMIVNATPGMRVVAISNRRVERALGVFRYAGLEPVLENAASRFEQAAAAGQPVITEDPMLVCRSAHIDIVVEVTGSVEFGLHVTLEAMKNGKHVVLMNAELDATLGPILQVYAQKYGVILSACDGDEPGLQMNLYRWVKGLGPHAACGGQRQGPAGSLPQSDHASWFCRKMGSEPGDGDVLCGRIEDQLRADDRGECHGLQGTIEQACPVACNTRATS